MKSILAVPIPRPSNCGAFMHLIRPGGGALANLAQPGGWAFAYPGATPGLLIHRWFLTLRISSERTSSSSQIGSSIKVEDWTNLWRLSRFYALISSLLIKAQLELPGMINVH